MLKILFNGAPDQERVLRAAKLRRGKRLALERKRANRADHLVLLRFAQIIIERQPQ